jgi:triosephosphate isomerase
MRRTLVVANWKMHGSLAANQSLIQQFQALLGQTNTAVAICPPFVYLAQLQSLLAATDIALGAQNLSDQASGAFTGEVSASMLADLSCRYVIVGHSERRAIYAETDAQVAVKFAQAQAHGLTPILCVGETLAERESGQTMSVVLRQLDAVIAQHGVKALVEAVIAYEPVWAIGTGKTATPEQAQEVHRGLREHIQALCAETAAAVQILYGGSVKADNVVSLFAQMDIDGALVGGASLKAEEFAAICRAN